jgi:hypothetical protein
VSYGEGSVSESLEVVQKISQQQITFSLRKSLQLKNIFPLGDSDTVHCNVQFLKPVQYFALK